MGRTYSYDVKTLLSDGAAAYVASGIGQVSSANAILNVNPSGVARTDLGVVGTYTQSIYTVKIAVSAVTTATDGNYNIWVMGSNNSNGSNPVVLGCMKLALGTAIPNGAGSNAQTDILGTGSTSTAGLREIFFVNEQNGVSYQYIYLYVEVLGSTSKSITFKANYARLPDGN